MRLPERTPEQSRDAFLDLATQLLTMAVDNGQFFSWFVAGSGGGDAGVEVTLSIRPLSGDAAQKGDR